jgi:hypothetical protein
MNQRYEVLATTVPRRLTRTAIANSGVADCHRDNVRGGVKVMQSVRALRLEDNGEGAIMNHWQTMECLCPLIGQSQAIMREQAALLAMHGIGMDGDGLETNRVQTLQMTEGLYLMLDWMITIIRRQAILLDRYGIQTSDGRLEGERDRLLAEMEQYV